MTTARLLLLILLAAAGAFFAPGARAQQHPLPPDRAEVLERLERDANEQQERADRFASSHRIPKRLPQAGGRWVELVGFVEGRPIYLTTHNGFAAQVTGTAQLHPGQALGLDLTGLDLTVGVWDAGHARSTHVELLNRVRTPDTAETDDHATHVAGTIAAAGVRADARGMAFEANVVSYDWSNDVTEMTNEAQRGLLVSNHSYGTIAGWYHGDLENQGDQWYWAGDPDISGQEDYAFGWYGHEAVQFDRTAYASPYLLPVVSAGNDRIDAGPVSGTYRGLNGSGEWQNYSVTSTPRPPDGGAEGFDTISGSAVAKNVLTVGSVRASSTGVPLGPSRFSSFGPTDDGRVKPDVMGYGEGLLSALGSSDAAYGRSSGTSMSAPNVAGTAVLLQQLHHRLLGTYMRASTLKGVLIHSARDLGIAGPDYQTGWGVVDAAAAAEHILASVQNPAAVREELLRDGGEFVQPVTVDGDGPVRITLSWTDPPSTRSSAYGPSSLDDPRRHLKNDLDLRLVEDATGEVFLPYRLDPVRPGEPAAAGDNDVDPVEQIFVETPRSGAYTIVVDHKGALDGRTAQPFSLLVTGARSEPPVVAVAIFTATAEDGEVVISWKTLFEGDEGRFTIERAPARMTSSGIQKTGNFTQVASVESGGSPDAEQSYVVKDGEYRAGLFFYRLVFESDGGRVTAAEVSVNIPPPANYAVVSNYPNPFTDRTEIVLDVPAHVQASIEVYDVTGRRMVDLGRHEFPPGRHHVPVDAAGWAPGVYLVRVQADARTATHAMLLVR